MRYTLVVIDMQTAYEVARPIIGEVIALIEQAKRDQAPIVIVEYNGSGPTYLEILRATESYMPSCRIAKKGFGGGQEVLAACQERGYPTSEFRVCGVYSDCCVQATCEQIAEAVNNLAKIEVYRRACEDAPFSKFHWINLLKGMYLVVGPIPNPSLA